MSTLLLRLRVAGALIEAFRSNRHAENISHFFQIRLAQWQVVRLLAERLRAKRRSRLQKQIVPGRANREREKQAESSIPFRVQICSYDVKTA